MADLKSRIDAVEERIARACEKAGRARTSVTLVAVSKTHPADVVCTAYGHGLRTFGENYAQEFAEKHDALAAECPELVWHFIGHLQRNKAKLVAPRASVVETVDSFALGEALSQKSQGRRLELFVQVNVAREPQKAGCAPEETEALVRALGKLPGVTVVGLMTIPPASESAEDSRPHFRALGELAQRLDLSGLSMGMSHDFEVAIEEGATVVRVGTAIFGKR